MVVIAVHFRSAFSNGDDGFAEVDGIWQVSDEPDLVEEGEEHGEMAVREVDPSAMTVSMTNRRGIILKPDDDLRLFGVFLQDGHEIARQTHGEILMIGRHELAQSAAWGNALPCMRRPDAPHRAGSRQET